MKSVIPPSDYATYDPTWQRVAKAGLRSWNVDTAAAGHRYLSLTAVVLSAAVLAQLGDVTRRFSALLTLAVEGIVADSVWWSALAWPWPAIALARQDPGRVYARARLLVR